MSDSISRSEHRERLDRRILQALGERRALREQRTRAGSAEWDILERDLARATAVLWETASNLPLHDELLAWCAFFAREMEVTESLGLDAPREVERLRKIAPYALEALDALTQPLQHPDADANPVLRLLADVFGTLRARLLAGTQRDFCLGLIAA